jgi:hypothetical protein
MATQSIKEKFKSIDQSKISDQAKKALQLMKEATDNFKDEDAVSKIRPKFESLYDKIKAAKPDAIRGGVKVVAKPATAAQTKSVKTAASSLSLSAKKRISEAKKERKSQGISTSKSDIEKDSTIKAIRKTGRRVSQGLRANRYGSKAQNKGNVYYEYRNNRYDKNPNSAPRLERGGMMAKGGKTVEKPLSYYKYETPKVRILWQGKVQGAMGAFRSAEEAYEEIKKVSSVYGNMDEYSIQTPDKTIKLSKDGVMASGGMMSHGGETHRFEQKKKVRFDDGGMIDHDTYEVIIKSNNGVNQNMFYGSNIGEVFEDAMNSLEDNQEIISIAKV